MQASFVIPLFNGLAFTRACLDSLRTTLPPGLVHEIVLVDDGSTDGTREWLAGRAGGERIMLNAANLGFAGACNRGAAAARGTWLFFLNSDLVLRPGWFEPMAALLAGRPDAAIVGNVQRRARTGALDHAGVRFDAKGKPVHDLSRPLLARLRGWRPVPAVTGACIGLRRATWDELGGFDESFRNGGEDIDLALRARAAGFRNYVALRSVVDHHVGGSPGRKLRDEDNSRRLATRWRAEIGRLAAPAWGRRHLAALRAGGRDRAALILAANALLAQYGWPPGRALRDAVDAALAVEFRRWDTLLDGVPAGPPVPADPAVLVL
jgi:GT2 family glycosyltransferase